MSGDGHTLTGSAGGHEVLSIVLDKTAGTYSVDLKGPIDHPEGADSISLPGVGIVTTATGGLSQTSSLTVNIGDDAPVQGDAQSHTATLGGNVNLVIVMDTSLSMTQNNANINRIELMKDAVSQMLKAYADGSDEVQCASSPSTAMPRRATG